jgi:hypothetical protein
MYFKNFETFLFIWIGETIQDRSDEKIQKYDAYNQLKEDEIYECEWGPTSIWNPTICLNAIIILIVIALKIYLSLSGKVYHCASFHPSPVCHLQQRQQGRSKVLEVRMIIESAL